jgi:hypothetical protein
MQDTHYPNVIFVILRTSLALAFNYWIHKIIVAKLIKLSKVQKYFPPTGYSQYRKKPGA